MGRPKRIMNRKEIHTLVREGRYRITFHTLKRCDQRGISLREIESVLLEGDLLEDYPDDKPYPSCLLMGRVRAGLPLYVVCAVGAGQVHVITAHWLDPDKWLDPKTRREKR